MNKRYLTNNRKTSRDAIRREKDPIPWRYCLVTILCGTLLVGGFFLAARNHFTSIDFGIRNSTLRKQIEDLEADKRRLMWLRETALAPTEIKKAARRIGLTEAPTTIAASFASAPADSRDVKVVKTTAEVAKPLVQKTVDSKPVVKLPTARAANEKSVPSRVQIAKN